MIPVVLKNALLKRILLCESDDPDLNFVGDLGAVGRISCGEDNLTLDIKGRNYSGTINSGPTVLVLNTIPTTLLGSSQENQQIWRVDYVVNEFCHLNFEKDILASMMGVSGGKATPYFSDDDDSVEAGTKSNKKRNITRSEDNDEYRSSGSEGEDDDIDATKKKAKKKAPKISTITQRKRQPTGKGTKKKSSQKKVSKKG